MADPRVTEARLVVDPSTTGILQGPHDTTGLSGWWALDIQAPASSPFVAPEPGTIERVSGHDPSEGIVGTGGIFGFSEFFRGVSGREYFFTHLDTTTVAPGQHVRAGDELGTVGDFPDHPASFNHIHWAIQGRNVESALSTDYFAALLRPVTDATGATTSGPSIDPTTGLVTNAQSSDTSGVGASGSTSTTPSGDTKGDGGGGFTGTVTAALCLGCLLPGVGDTALCKACKKLAETETSTAKSAARAAMSVPEALHFIFSIRFLEIIGGGLLILLGISLLGKQLGVNVPAVPGV